MESKKMDLAFVLRQGYNKNLTKGGELHARKSELKQAYSIA